MAKAGLKGQVILTSRPALTLTNEVLTNSGDNTTFFIPLAQSAKRYLDPDTVLVFETSPDGLGSWTPATPTSVQHVGGRVTFAAPVAGATPSARIASGKYLPWATIGDVYEWTYDEDRAVLESTCMTTNGTPTRNRKYVPNLSGATAKVTKWHDPANVFLQLVTEESLMVVSLIIDVTAGTRLEAFALATKASLASSLDALQDEPLEFQLSGKRYFVAS